MTQYKCTDENRPSFFFGGGGWGALRNIPRNGCGGDQFHVYLTAHAQNDVALPFNARKQSNLQILLVDRDLFLVMFYSS